MSFKWVQQKKQYLAYRRRIENLPEPYSKAMLALDRYIIHMGGMDDSDSILVMLDDLVTLFETAAAEKLPVRDVVGADPVEFVEDFLSNYPQGKWRAKERARLTGAISECEQKQNL